MMGPLAKLIFIYLFLFSGHTMNAKECQSPIYLQYVSEITRAFAEEMERDLDLVCIGGGGSMPRDVQEISVKFIAYQRASINQARELEVEATQRLMELINGHEKIRPYLREYPFKAHRAEVAISFNKPNNSRYTDGSVTHVFQVKNKIFYFREDGHSVMAIDLGEEPYEEAVKIVQAKKDSRSNLQL